MASSLLGMNPIPEPMMIICQLDTLQKQKKSI